MYWLYKGDIQLWVERISTSVSSPTNHQILLLHDALGSIPQWKHFPKQLSEQLQAEVILYERQGHGRSSPLHAKRSPDFFHKEALEVLPAFIEAHQLQEAIILGHSDGATIALLYAAHFNPKAVIAIAPHIFVEDTTLQGILLAMGKRDVLISKLRKYHEEKAANLFDVWTNTWTAPEFKPWSIQKELSGITCPLLLLQGEKDEYGSLKQLEGIQAVVPHAEISLLPGVGHSPHSDEAAIPLIKNWLLAKHP